MRHRLAVLLALLSLVIGVGSCTTDPANVVDSTSSTPEAGQLPLAPYTSREGGFSAAYPAGWVEFSPGHFRAPGRTEPSVLALLSYPGQTVEEINELAEGIRQLEQDVIKLRNISSVPLPGEQPAIKSDS